jgi:hypothetical protein
MEWLFENNFEHLNYTFACAAKKWEFIKYEMLIGN